MNRLRAMLLTLTLHLLLGGPVAADELVVEHMQSAPAIPTPQPGQTMDNVRRHFGNPVVEQPTVSVDGGPFQPPITRWDYEAFSVVFERDRVVHSVVHHQ